MNRRAFLGGLRNFAAAALLAPTIALDNVLPQLGGDKGPKVPDLKTPNRTMVYFQQIDPHTGALGEAKELGYLTEPIRFLEHGETVKFGQGADGLMSPFPTSQGAELTGAHGSVDEPMTLEFTQERDPRLDLLG